MDDSVQDFVLRVFERAPPDLPVGVLREAIGHYGKRGRIGKADVSDCILHAGRMVGEQAELETEPMGGSFFGGIEPDVEVTSEILLERLAPRISAVRTKVFGSPAPPFESLDEAVAWIESEARRKVEKDQSESLDQLAADTIELADRWSCHVGAPVSIRLDRPALDYLRIAEGKALVSCKKVCFGTALLELKEFTGPASQETGIEEHCLVSHVLVGTRPYLTGISVGHQIMGDRLRPARTTITLRRRRVTWRDLEAAYSFVQELSSETYPGLLVDRKDRAILGVIQKRGKLPRGRVPRKHWEEIAAELRPRFPELTPDAVRMRVRRMEREKGLGQEALFRAFDGTQP